ncbi:hypothetical protein Goklo_004790, partial [Gossypium klotzschianum]|nr:hypothetical protein [Gossypium klotzschianum]
GFSKIYPRCNSTDETLIHTLKDCPKVRDILVIGDLNNRLLDGNYDRCIDWLEDVLRELDNKVAVDFFHSALELLERQKQDAVSGQDGCYCSVNVDSAVSFGCIGFGAIARDHDGFVLGGYYGHSRKSVDAIWAELEALFEGLNLASRLHVDNLILESDNAWLVNTVKKREQHVTILGQCVKQECKAFRNFDSV